jgi:hypothetical protein
VCPGRSLVLLVTSTMLRALLERGRLRQAHERPLEARRALPSVLSPFRLVFEPPAG